MATNKPTNSSKPSNVPSKPVNAVANASNAVALTLSEAESKLWEAARKSALVAANAELSKLDAAKILELASQRVARLLDEKHNSAAKKLAAVADPATLSLTSLLDSKRLSGASKEATQDSFATLLMSGVLSGAAKSKALEVFKGGKVAEMAAFLTEFTLAASKGIEAEAAAENGENAVENSNA